MHNNPDWPKAQIVKSKSDCCRTLDLKASKGTSCLNKLGMAVGQSSPRWSGKTLGSLATNVGLVCLLKLFDTELRSVVGLNNCAFS